METQNRKTTLQQSKASPFISYHAPSDEPARKGRKRKYWAFRHEHRRKRCPARLRFDEVLNLILADLHASKIGQRLCSFFTFTWALTADGENDINKRWQLLLDAFRKWAWRRGFELRHVWVHENPSTGFNSHMLANVPPAHREAAVAWLEEQLGAMAGGVHARPRVTAEWRGPDETRDYMLKGTDRGTALHFRLIKKRGWKCRQGIVPFQRCGCSRNLNRTAREFFEAEFSEQEETRCDAGVSQPQKGGFRNSITRVREAEIITC